MLGAGIKIVSGASKSCLAGWFSGDNKERTPDKSMGGPGKKSQSTISGPRKSNRKSARRVTNTPLSKLLLPT
jgi:hypothetical protein